MLISERARAMQESPIRKLSALANQTKKRGINVYHLNIGQPDLETPPTFFQSIASFQQKVLDYGPSDGLEILKTAMINYFRRYQIELETKNIIITSGGSEAISFAMNVICDPQDEIIVFEPFYTNYNGYAALSNIKLIPITGRAEDGFHLPPRKEIEKKINYRTRAILICSPNNPTGTVYSREELQTIAAIAAEHRLFIIADEVYKEFTYDGKKHISILEFPEVAQNVIVVDSISKRFSACGARIGAVISRNEEVMKAVLKFAQARLCPPTLEQYGAVAAYQLQEDYFQTVRNEYQKRRDLLFNLLTSNQDIMLKKPEGAFYLMVKLPIDDCNRFSRWLLEHFNQNNSTLMVAPGDGFYSTPNLGKQEVRLAYVLECPKLQIAGELLLTALKDYKKR